MIETEKNAGPFAGCIEIRDLGCIAALQMRRILPAHRIQQGSRLLYYYADSPQTRELVEDYLSGKLQDSLLGFRSAFSAVTQQIRKPRQ